MRRHGADAIPDVLLAGLLITLLALALPIALLQVYDRILPQAAHGTLWLMLGAVTVAILAETALRMARAQILARLAAAGEAKTHRAAISQALGAPSAAFDRHGNGWYSERLAAIGTMREMWSGPALQAMLDVPFAALYLLAIWFLAGQLVLVPLTLLAGMIALGWASGRAVRRRAEALALAEERRFNFLFDIMRGLQSLKLLGAEGLLERRYERLQDATSALRRRLTTATSFGQEASMLMSHFATVAVTVWGCLMVLDGELTVGGLGACTMLAGRCMQPLLGGVALWSRLQSLRDAQRRVAELAELPQEAKPLLPPLRLSQGAIALESVRFGQMADGSWLFDGLSLDVRPGEFIGINGANGSGRSVLLKLITGEIRPASGRVLLDEQDLRHVDLVPARGRVALVMPNPPMVRGSLLDNLTLHQPHLREPALRLGAALGLDGIAASLTGDWHTQVGAGATPLPQGVAQRVGMVRALVQQPLILLLDDVHAQLDMDGDRRLAEVLATLRGQMTVLMVTHRRSALALADRVLHVEGGRLVVAS
ncbi:MAG: ABC transporter transmembrane domain-containing protein [Pseudomonadota bacterium]